MTLTEIPTCLQLQVGERREVLILHAPGDQVVVRAACTEQPRAVVPDRRPALEHDVAVGDAEGGRALEISTAPTVVDDEERGETVAVGDPEASGGEVEVLHRLGIEGARDPEEAVRIVDLDPVHHREVLIRCATAHREPTAEVVRRGHARHRVECAEDVVDAACDSKNLLRGNRIGRRSFLRDGLGYDLDRLGERVPEEPDLEVRTLHRQGRLQVAVRLEPQRCFALTQHDGETPVRASCDRLQLAFDTHVGDWCRRGAVNDDTRDRGRFLSRSVRRPREQSPDQEQVCRANDRGHSQQCTGGPATVVTRTGNP